MEKLHADGKSAYAYTCDVSSSDDVTKMAAKVRKDIGDVDILVNNAGIVCGKRLLNLTEAEIRRTLEVNTLALFLVSYQQVYKVIIINGCIVSVFAKKQFTLQDRLSLLIL